MNSVWEVDTPSFRDRKRAARACSACHKRKRRCYHTFTKTSEIKGVIPETPSRTLQRQDDGHDTFRPATREGPIGERNGASPSRTPLSNTFIGDSNPESALRAESSTTAKVRESRIGVWVQDGDTTPEPSRNLERTNLEPHDHDMVGRATLSVPENTKRALIKGYFAKIHPLIPLLHQTSSSLQDYPADSLIILALCLVACKDDESSSFLRLSEGGPLLSARQFASSLHRELVSALHNQAIDRIERIEALALLSLHQEGPNGLEQSSLHLLQAVHQAQSLGIHIECPRRRRLDAGQGARLFWCLWSLDKLNGSIGGRPIFIADRDIGIPWPVRQLESEGLIAFAKWLEISQTLAAVTDYYRPTTPSDATGWEHHYPSFEDVVGDGADENIGEPVLGEDGSSKILNSSLFLAGILEVYYNAAAILSCRSQTPGTASCTRQDLSAFKIEKLAPSLKSISYLPLVPYAISLSLVVAYHHLRHGKLKARRDAAKRSISVCCQALEKMQDKWWSAGAMAKLGMKALDRSRDDLNSSSSRLEALKENSTAAPNVGASSSAIAVDSRPTEEPITEHRRLQNLDKDVSEERTQSTEDLGPSNVLHDFSGATTYSFDELDHFLGEYADLSFPTELYSTFEDLTNTDLWPN